MKKSAKRMIKVCLITPMVVLVIMYLLLAWYYKDTFNYGTWINGVYCTGKSLEEINQELIENMQLDSLLILLPEGDNYKIPLSQIDYQIDYMNSLVVFQKEQNALEWVTNIFDYDGRIIKPICKFSEDLLIQELEKSTFFQTAKTEDAYKISIRMQENGYTCNETKESILDLTLAYKEIENSLFSGKTKVKLYEQNFYYELPMTREDLKTISVWNKIKKAQDFNMVFMFGEEEEIIDAKIVSNWIMVNEQGEFVFDEQGDLVIDETKIQEYIHSLALKYNTYTYPRSYTTIKGKKVTISKGNYGNLFDEANETSYLMQAYENQVEEIHIPTYQKKALYQGTDDIGPDYIEIDLTNQKMYLVIDDKLNIETDVVTGNIAAGMKTTDRICYIYAKMKNRILRGDGYASQVDFWMPIYGGIGIHDAKWRKSFGGEIYKTNGSHGCINTPREVMEEFYELSFVGMPVIMYY